MSVVQADWRSLAEGAPGATLDGLLRRHAAEKPDAAAVISPARVVTWAQLDTWADRLAGVLAARGLTAGDRLGWLGRNGVAFPIVLAAARRAGLVLVGLNWRLSARELAALVGLATPALTIVDAEFAALPPEGAPQVLTDAVLDDMTATAQPPALQAPPADALATLFFTSGTTGDPRAFAYRGGAADHMLFAPTTLAFTPDSRLLIVAPVFHTAGWVWTQYALAGGMTQIQLPAATPAAMLDAVERWGVTHAQWVPAMLDAALKEHVQRDRDLSSLRMIAYGASPIADSLLDACLTAFGCDFTQVYGLTESMGALTHLPPAAHRARAAGKAQATGLANPGVMLKIVDEAGGEVAAGELGEIWARCPYPIAEHWSQGATRPVTDGDGWLHTGDIGWVDTDGYLYVVDRKNDVIITGGENVYPVEVEKVLAGLPGVGEAAVFALPHPRWGQTVAAALVPAAGAALDLDHILARCRDALAHYKCPTRLFQTACLPRNASGKVLRRALTQAYAA